MVKLEILSVSKDKNKLSFILKDASAGYSNTLRRTMMQDVPVMAIEEVEFRKNNSSLYDEMIAHRLGLMPLTTELKTYELPASQADIDERKAKCTVQLTLKEKGPKTVYASDFKTADPKIKPVYPNMPIVKLLKDQEIELIATAVLGLGKKHAKWAPGHVWYTYSPKITVSKTKDIEQFKDMYPPQAFNSKGQIDEKLIVENNLVDAVANINEGIVKVEYSDNEFVFHVESWGQLNAKEILTTALDRFDMKLDELSKLF